MINREFVERVWDYVGDALAAEGFALGGGLAMRAHGIVDRDTQDIDAFRRDPVLSQPEALDRAEGSIVRLLAEAGLDVVNQYHQDFTRRFEVTDPRTGDSTNIDIGRDRLPDPFVSIAGYGMVISRDDMAGMKMRALYERHAERDYIDYDAMRRSGLWTVGELVALLDRTGSIDPPIGGEWRPRLVSVLSAASDDADEILLEDLGVDDVPAFFRRLETYAREHVQDQ